MFRQCATLVSPDALFDAHPSELAGCSSDVGVIRLTTADKVLGDPDRRSEPAGDATLHRRSGRRSSAALEPILAPLQTDPTRCSRTYRSGTT